MDRNHARRNCPRCGRPIRQCYLGGHAVSDAMLDALRKFRDEHGKQWKSRLSLCWMRGDDLSPELRQVRNVIGPSRLYKIDV